MPRRYGTGRRRSTLPAMLLALLAVAFGAVTGGFPGRTVQATPYPSAYGLTQAVNAATFSRMVDMVAIPGYPDEAVIALQKDETIRRVSLSGAFAPALYGDLSAYVGGTGNEEGLLSVAFSPDFQSDGRVYVYYTQGSSQGSQQPTVLSRFQVSGGVMVTVGPGAETRILGVPDFAENHNGGKIVFGADGYLYLSLGDGGGGGDPQDNGQDLADLRGKVLRIDVTGQATYAIPPDNPFSDGPGGNADEIYAYGFRNPWRMSYDWTGGEIWVGDVGQNAWEEVEAVAKGGNHGWDCYEGFASYEPSGCPASGFVAPRAVYGHDEGCSVTGGYVYRGASMPELNGWYVYGDFCSGKIWAVNTVGSAAPVLLADTGLPIASFAELPDGELVVVTFANAVHRLARGL